MSAYRRYNRSAPRPRPARWLDVKYAGTCGVCGASLSVGARAFYDPATRALTCTSLDCAGKDGLTRTVWHGSPMSGRWIETLAETRIGAPYVGARVHYGRGNTHRRDGYRCVDAPCCGCCY